MRQNESAHRRNHGLPIVVLFLTTALPVLTASAWVSSHFLSDWVHFHDPDRPLYAALTSSTGHVIGSWERSHANYGAGWDGSFRSGVYRGGSTASIWPKFFVESVPNGPSVYRFDLPYWLLTLLATIPAVIAWRRRIRHLRASRAVSRNRCPQCGYDMRASPERCPECGLRRVPTFPA
jgi:hypothetical protein